MNKLAIADRSRVIAALVEGCSVRSTVRMTGVAKNTVAKLLVEIGEVCAGYMGEHFTKLPCKRIEVDEIWSFVACKQKNVPQERQGEYGVGDVWTWVALDAETKLVVSWMVGLRDGYNAKVFMEDLASRLANRVQLTSDGHRAYLDAVDHAFNGDIDYAMLVKIYGKEGTPDTRYSPATCIGCETHSISGNPDPKYVSTSYVERQNLTMRMGIRRFTRLTNAFSKKIENHEASIALHYFYYNFCRVHKTLKTTPAVAAGVTDHVWTLEELVGLLAKKEQAAIKAGAMKRGAYKKNSN